jgi:hypothetical protein
MLQGFKEIYSNDYKNIDIRFIGKQKKFSVINGACFTTRVLKLKKENQIVNFELNENNKEYPFICNDNDINKDVKMNFSLMKSLIELLILSGYEVLTSIEK